MIRVENLIEPIPDTDPLSAEQILALIRESSHDHDWKEFQTDLQCSYNYHQVGLGYSRISAFIKSLRGSDPNAAVYYLARMLDGGEDPKFIARRMVILASEDIGNADPRALTLALEAYQVVERLGQPEGDLALAQAVLYLACCAKSNACYVAFQKAEEDVRRHGSLPVPLHIRNAPTSLMKRLEYGKHYRYAHDEPDAYAAGENYFPEELAHKVYYEPVARGLEIKIKAKLAALKAKDKQEAPSSG